MRSEKPICAPPHFSEVSPTLPLKQFQCSSDRRWPSRDLSGKIFDRFLFPRLSPPGDRSVMSLALCPQVVAQAPQYFRSSEMQATCYGSFARQLSICSVISLHSGSPGQYIHRSFRRRMSTIDMSRHHVPELKPCVFVP